MAAQRNINGGVLYTPLHFQFLNGRLFIVLTQARHLFLS
jgi:hypothetical protein